MRPRVRARARRGALSLLLAIAAPVAVMAQPVDTETRDQSRAVAAALRDQVGGRFKDVYRQRGYWPLWVTDEGPAPQAEALVSLIATLRADGLSPARYDLPRLRRMIEEARGGNPRALAAAELALSTAFAEIVRDMRRPRVEIRYLDESLEPAKLSPETALRQAALVPSLNTYVRQIGWMSPLYVRLRSVLAEAGDADTPQVTIPDGVVMHPGDLGPEVSLLRRRMGLADGDVFDPELAGAVRAFQRARGLGADGVVGARTIAALNARSAGGVDRALLHLNLERARLLPGAYTRHIVVDAASARLWYFGEGATQGMMRVVVGTAETQTPMMAGVVRYATLNPFWNVPVDLVRKRIAPKVLAGQRLEALGYEALSDWTADARVIPSSEIDWRGVAAGNVEARVRELPGKSNSMGRVKYMFPNDMGIYLHDTNDKSLFGKPDRHFSNGCVRLQDADRLGRWLFGRKLQPDGTAPEQHVPLPEPVPVYLMYFTASPDEDGVTYAADTYRRDPPALEHFGNG
ncbi:L,D-transpeptidase family protein [Sphingomonas sp.]|uniref:L,D-transpeptidase family protein n=1 Tax=Sphingomonas sp. TaxID=28214 RepID=UPI0035C81DD8